MIAKIVLSSFLLLLTMLEITGISAKQKSLKIIIPSKIRYVHHHHTHVVLMKDKKPHRERSPDTKFHHIHYYQDGTGGGRKNKGVSHHYYIPFLPQPAEDEAEDESVAKYTISHPKNNRIFPKQNFVSTRPLPPVYDEQPYQTFPRKFRLYDRKSKEAYTPPRSVMEYYETDPYFPVVMNPVPDHATAGSANVDYEYKEELMPHYTGEHDFDSGQLFYPEKSFYDSSDNYPRIY